MRKFIVCLSIIMIMSINVYSFDSSALLFNSFNADTIGRGGVNTAWNDKTDFLGNPSLLASIENLSFSVSYWKYILDMSFMNTSFIYNSGKNSGTFGVNLNMFDSGEFTLFDGTGNSFENISGKNILFSIAYGVPVKYVKKLDFGIGMKYINNSLYKSSASGVAFDTGIVYKLNLIRFGTKSIADNFFIGMSAINLGTGLKYKNEESDLPLTLKFGIMHNIFKNKTVDVKYGVDLSYTDEYIGINSGMELCLLNFISIRAGYSLDNDMGNINSGIGIKYVKDNMKLLFDYSFIPMSDFGSTHNVSLGIVLNKDLFETKSEKTKVQEVE